jgi:hypothetical protein
LHFDPDDGVNIFLRNVRSYPKTLKSTEGTSEAKNEKNNFLNFFQKTPVVNSGLKLMNGTQRPNLLAVDLGRKVAGGGDLARQHLTAVSVDDAQTKQHLARTGGQSQSYCPQESTSNPAYPKVWYEQATT